MIRFLVDEGCDSIIVRALRQAGYDVEYIAEIAKSITDDEVLSLGLQGERIIITEDTDFVELIFEKKQHSHGVILIRIPDDKRTEKSNRILALMNNHLQELTGAMTTLTLTNIRIRPLPN